MSSLKFKFLNFDQSIFVSINQKNYISIYLNNLFIIEPDIKKINEIKGVLFKQIKISNLKFVFHYLNLNIYQNWEKKNLDFYINDIFGEAFK